MIHSLRFRLLAAAILLIVVTLGGAVLLFGRFTTSRFMEFVALDRSRQNQRLQEMLEDHVAHAGGFAGAGPLLEQIARLGGRRMLLVEAGGAWRAAPPGALAGATVESPRPGEVTITRRGVGAGRASAEQFVFNGGLPIHSPSGAVVGTLYPLPDPPRGGPERGAFLASMNRSLLSAAAIAGLLALAVTVILSRRIVRPIEELTAAVRRLEGGRLDARVEARGRDELGELSRAFNAMAERLLRTERLRKDLVSDVAHELRTPITNLRGQIEALEDGLATPDSKTLASLHEDVLLLQRLVEDLQDLALAEAGQLPLHLEPRDVGREVQGAAAAMMARAQAAGVALTVTAEPELPAARLDPARFRQILANLLGNALRHTPRGGRVEARVSRSPRGVAVAVRDSGPGIEAEHLPRIFDRFYRTDPSRARDSGGAGLGLAIAKQLAEAHGGSLAATSPAGGGACFTLELPASS